MSPAGGQGPGSTQRCEISLLVPLPWRRAAAGGGDLCPWPCPSGSEGTSGGSPSDLFPIGAFLTHHHPHGERPRWGGSSQLAIRGPGPSLVSPTPARAFQPPGPGRSVEVPPGRPGPALEAGTPSLPCVPWLDVIHTATVPGRGGSGKASVGSGANRASLWALSRLCLIPLSSRHRKWRGWRAGKRPL